MPIVDKFSTHLKKDIKTDGRYSKNTKSITDKGYKPEYFCKSSG